MVKLSKQKRNQSLVIENLKRQEQMFNIYANSNPPRSPSYYTPDMRISTKVT